MPLPFYFTGTLLIPPLAERTLVGMVAELDEMLNSVREGRAPSVGGAEGRAALAAVLAVYESSATGQWITVT